MEFFKNLWSKIKSFFIGKVSEVEQKFEQKVGLAPSLPVVSEVKPFKTVGMAYSDNPDVQSYTTDGDQRKNPNSDRRKNKIPYNPADHSEGVAKWKTISGEKAKYNAFNDFTDPQLRRAINESDYFPWTGKNFAGVEVTLNYSEWVNAASMGNLG